MKLTFEDNNEILKLEVKEGNVKEGFTGYRLGNKILLSRETFKRWHDALVIDNFACMKEIIESCLEFESYKLEANKIKDKQLSYNSFRKVI